MRDDEIIKLWKSGLSKYQVAKVYERRNRYERFITKYEALAYVEKVILEEIRRYE